jgi:hypothetical protein
MIQLRLSNNEIVPLLKNIDNQVIRSKKAVFNFLSVFMNPKIAKE